MFHSTKKHIRTQTNCKTTGLITAFMSVQLKQAKHFRSVHSSAFTYSALVFPETSRRCEIVVLNSVDNQ